MSRALRVVLAVMLLAPAVAAGSEKQLRRTLDFAAEMAEQGNWREARYRWEQAIAQSPDNPRILNNLAVAAEILGDVDQAATYYQRAIALEARDDVINDNVSRFESFWRQVRAGDDPRSDGALSLGGRPARVRSRFSKNAVRVSGRFQLPPRLDLSGYETILVASFLTEESDLLDTNREITRYLRSEFRKRSSLEPINVTPAPAVPEMNIDDLAANAEFWRYLGREFDADLIVSGAVTFSRQDSSGFQDVDVVSSVTGQKVRQTRFVEQEQFTYSMELIFLNGATGELVFRDRLDRIALYSGGANDPLTAFYGLVDSIVKDVLAVVSPRVREDTRIIYRS